MIDILPIIAGIEGEWIEHCDRMVFQHKIDNTQYMPIWDSDCEKGIDRTWYLMIEQNGTTWIWDGYIMEG